MFMFLCIYFFITLLFFHYLLHYLYDILIGIERGRKNYVPLRIKYLSTRSRVPTIVGVHAPKKNQCSFILNDRYMERVKCYLQTIKTDNEDSVIIIDCSDIRNKFHNALYLNIER